MQCAESKNEACDRESELARDREQANTNTRAHATKKMMPNDINQFCTIQHSELLCYGGLCHIGRASIYKNRQIWAQWCWEMCQFRLYDVSIAQCHWLDDRNLFSQIYCAVYWKIYLFHVRWVVIPHTDKCKRNAINSNCPNGFWFSDYKRINLTSNSQRPNSPVPFLHLWEITRMLRLTFIELYVFYMSFPYYYAHYFCMKIQFAG